MPQPDAVCWFGADHCFDATSAIALCAYIYGAAALFALIINIHRASMREHGRASMLLPARRIRFFPALLFIAFVNRAAWFILVDFHAMETRSSATAPYEHVVVREFNMTVDLYPVGVVIWEKLATLVYFSAFSLVVQFWSDVVAQSTTTSSRLAHQFLKTRTSSRTRNVLAIVNVWMYLVELSLLVMNTLQVKLPAPIVYPDSFVVAAFYGALSVMMVRLSSSCGRIRSFIAGLLRGKASSNARDRRGVQRAANCSYSRDDHGFVLLGVVWDSLRSLSLHSKLFTNCNHIALVGYFAGLVL
ncbi:hypothetical protein AC1031_006012 [Aphanomyces cochlioides]|nr:hypothetical protein AC1031_006012 [Aphanomyces cochlioides]